MTHPLTRMWSQLPVPTAGEFRMGQIDETLGGDPIQLAVDQEGFHHLLIPSDGGDRSFSLDGNSLQARMKTVVIERLEFQSFLDIFCVNKTLNGTFDRLVAEVIEAAKNSDDPISESISRLSEWQDLFNRKKQRSISPQQRIGLFAELTVLLEFLQSGEVSDTSCWTGPAKDPHDFEFGSMSLEVKAYGAGAEMITFHGPLQLDNIGAKPLFLCIREVAEDPDGRSLLEIVDQIESLVEDHQHFRSTANKLGILSDDRALQEYRYKVERETLMEVNESTPRIVASSFVDGIFPEGIEALRYSIFPEDLMVDGGYASFETWLEETCR